MRNDKSSKDEGYEAERVPDGTAPFEMEPKKVALAAVDWMARPYEKGPRARTHYSHGFDPFLSDVAATAEAEGCDTVVYALWSHDLRKMEALSRRRRRCRSRVSSSSRQHQPRR